MFVPSDMAIFAAAGFLLKIADYTGETKRNRILSIGPALVVAVFFWLLINSSEEYSTILLAIVIGSLVSRKVDRLNLLAGLGLLIALMIAYGFRFPLLLPLGILAIAAAMDEWGNDKRWKLNLASSFFRYRGVMKAVAVVLGSVNQISFGTVAGFYLFDVAYDFTSIAIERKAGLTGKLSPPVSV